MHHLEHGDVTREVPVTGNDELSEIARVFNAMNAEIQKTQGHLREERNKLATIIL
ncbi:MAG: HAMP domain-containing protein, partial [Magnetococcales bacterium]|nr:HAMP domain-containing protein [Magnetococcales bacterium]